MSREPNHKTKSASLRGKIGAFVLHSRYGGREITANARNALEKSFLDQVDPDRILPDEERMRRAAHAKSAHFARMALASARARAGRRKGGSK